MKKIWHVYQLYLYTLRKHTCVYAGYFLKYTNISNITGKSRTTITRLIKELKQKNHLRRVGSDKKGYWEIIEHDKNKK